MDGSVLASSFQSLVQHQVGTEAHESVIGFHRMEPVNDLPISCTGCESGNRPSHCNSPTGVLVCLDKPDTGRHAAVAASPLAAPSLLGNASPQPRHPGSRIGAGPGTRTPQITFTHEARCVRRREPSCLTHTPCSTETLVTTLDKLGDSATGQLLHPFHVSGRAPSGCVHACRLILTSTCRLPLVNQSD